MEKNTKVLEVKDLQISFSTDNGTVQAVRGVSFDLYKGETLCIVGESGSGKSVTSKAIMGILSANARVSGGSIIYEGEDLIRVSEEEFHRIRGHKIGMIFQDPLSSLNPIMKIGKQITEATLVNKNMLKRKFDDFISPELIAYKNLIASKNYEIQKLDYSVVALSAKLKKEDADLIKEKNFENKAEEKKLTKELAMKTKALVDQRKKEVKAQKIVIIDEFKKALPALKLKLKEASAKGKIYIEEFKAKVEKERDDFVLPKEKELAALISKRKELGKNQKEELKHINDSIASLNLEIENAKEDFFRKTKITKKIAKKDALEVMKEVGIPLPERRFKQYPFEFSGGMRQRIVIAIALTANPDILICDEPTTALDVTIQAQILELINKLKVSRNMSCIFITHDLGVVANMADRVAVMYAGKIVEYGLVNEIFFDPKHPYTWALLSSIPDIDSKERLDAIPGTPPNMIYPPKGDAFAVRSKYAMAIDYKYEPPYFKVSDTHYAATWLLHPSAPKVEMPLIVKTRIEKALKEASKNGK